MDEYNIAITDSITRDIIDEINIIREICSLRNINYITNRDYSIEKRKLRWFRDFLSMFNIKINCYIEDGMYDYILEYELFKNPIKLENITNKIELYEYNGYFYEVSYQYINILIQRINNYVINCMETGVDYKTAKYKILISQLNFIINILVEYGVSAMVYVENYLLKFDFSYNIFDGYEIYVKPYARSFSKVIQN